MKSYLLLIPQSLLIASLLTFVSGCSAPPKVPPGPATPLSDFVPFASARSFDRPGRIYRVDPGGTVWMVTQLDVTPQVGVEEIGEVASERTVSLAEVLETIGVAKEQIPAKLSAQLELKQKYITKSVSGERHYLDDTQVDNALPKAWSGINQRKDNKYYLIRETVATNNLSFMSQKGWLVNLGLDAEFKKLVENNTKLNWGSGSEFSMEKDFGQKLDVWYKPERLIINVPPGAGPGQLAFKRVPAAPGELTLPMIVQVSP